MRSLFASLLLVFSLGVRAQGFDCSLTPPPESQQDKLLWAYTDLLEPAEAERINAKLVQFARETSNRILVLIVDTLCGTSESDLAIQVGERWHIGKKEFDNGVVFLIKPTGGPGQRKVFIATGYGLEGAIPDATCKQIIENEVVPRFKQRDFYGGIDAALDTLMALAKGEFDHKSYGKKSFPWPVLIFLLFFIIVMIFSWRGRVKRYARTNNLDFWTSMWLLGQMNNRHSGRWGGGGGFGGGGGGGFGGFGGGSFGGGGAGGSW